jgi:hypothetical protein
VSGTALPPADDYFLALFKRDMKEKLVQAGISAIRPALEAAADEVLRNMKGRIVRAHDHYRDATIVHLVVDGVKQA